LEHIDWKYGQGWRGRTYIGSARGSSVIDAIGSIDAREKIDRLVVQERTKSDRLLICVYIQVEDIRQSYQDTEKNARWKIPSTVVDRGRN